MSSSFSGDGRRCRRLRSRNVVELLLLPVVADAAVEGEVVPEVEGQARVARRAPEILRVVALPDARTPDDRPGRSRPRRRAARAGTSRRCPSAPRPRRRAGPELEALVTCQPSSSVIDLEQGLGREVEVDVDHAVVVVVAGDRGELHSPGQRDVALEVAPVGVVRGRPGPVEVAAPRLGVEVSGELVRQLDLGVVDRIGGRRRVESQVPSGLPGTPTLQGASSCRRCVISGAR